MQLRHLRTFQSVAITLNFTRAAERLHLVQSSVTEQIQALEADLGAALFDRTKRRLALTAAGRRLLPYAQEVLALTAEARAAVAEIADTASGEIVVGGLETLCAAWLPALLSRYRSRCPDVQMRLVAGDSASLRGDLKAGALDVCFTFGSQGTDADLSSERLAEEELAIIVPPNHRLVDAGLASTDALLDEAFLITAPGCVYRRMFDNAFAATLPDRPRVVGEFASLGAICSLVEAGQGCALVPRIAVSPAVNNGAVVALCWGDGEATAPITMTWHPRRARTPALRLFLEEARGRRDAT